MKEKILRAVSKIIAKGGLEAVSTRAVCTEVGISAPTLYHYFNNKSELLDSVTLLAYERYTAKDVEGLKRGSPLKALLKIWEIYFEFVNNETELYLVILNAHMRGRIPQAGYDLFQSTLEVFFRADKLDQLRVKPNICAQIFYSSAQGSALVYLSQNKNQNMKKGIKLSRDICIRGLFKKRWNDND